MSFFDLPLEQLREYRPERNEPADFDAFWQATLGAVHQYPLNAQYERVDYGLAAFETFDVTFAGYGGQPIKGWFIRPTQTKTPLPCVVRYIGYGGGRGFPYEWLLWPGAGYATLVMDTRGQGSATRHGDTPDLPDGANPFYPGFMTQGILDPHTYYYRRVFTDAVRAVEAAQQHPDVDTTRIAVTGASQGGGICIAVSGLIPDQVAVSMPSVPFLCHFKRAIGLTDKHPYEEITRYLSVHRDRESVVYDTLAYFDGMHFAARTQAKSQYATALMDTICPPSTVFAAYNYVPALKEIRVYHFNNHEGGGEYHDLAQVRYLNALWR
ncbi:MAG: acetylxylan esterase [Chloroflexi bacterium]|nr:acetylxylan esterase [Chloroflexota bacterium]